MATIREYFDADPRALTQHKDWECRTGEEKTLFTVRAKIAHDFEANAKYWYFFLPEVADPQGWLRTLLMADETKKCVLSAEGETAYVEMGFADYPEKQTNASMIFTGRVFLYVDMELAPEDRRNLSELAVQCGYNVVVRDRIYAAKRSEYEKPLAFISHDWRDKDSLVRELAHEMISLMCPVWYDEYSLSVGDSLRESIEKGLKEAWKCIVVLSPNFFSNGGWEKAEFDSIYVREILEKKNVMLPVWHNLGAQEVFHYSPRLADKVGLQSSLGVKELARRLSNAVKASP